MLNQARKIFPLLTFLCVLFFSPSYALAETLTLTTYYPSPTGNFNNLSAKSLSIANTAAGQTSVSISNPTVGAKLLTLTYNTAAPWEFTNAGGGGNNLNLQSQWDNFSLYTDNNGDNSATAGFSVYHNGLPDGSGPSGLPKLVLTTVGDNVGIGVAAPTARLAIAGDRVNILMGNAGCGGIGYAGISVQGVLSGCTNYSLLGDGTNLFINRPTGGAMFFRMNNTNQMVLNTNGNVGIGVAAPGAKLHVIAPGTFGNEPIRAQSDSTFFSGVDGAGTQRFAINNDAGPLLNFYGWDNNWFNFMTINNVGTKAVSFNAGNVGIGSASPTTALETVGAIHVRDAGVAPDNSYAGLLRITRKTDSGQYINLIRAGNWPWSIGTVYNQNTFAIGAGTINNDAAFTNPFFVINMDGNVGIGVTTPGFKLEIAGNMQANGFFYPSDQRLKKDIHPIANALDKIQHLNGVDFTWKENDKKSIGVIAQNVETVFPELVNTNKEGMKSVEYGNLIAVLIEGVKEQQKQIQELKNEINGLKKYLK